MTYRLSEKKKSLIAHNLIGVVKNDESVLEDTINFIYGWVCSGPAEKYKAYYDVWDIVLSNYLPSDRPILFRSCRRINRNNKIVSFTGSIESARCFAQDRGESATRYPQERGLLLICDTKLSLEPEAESPPKGGYKYSFYSLRKVINKIIVYNRSKNQKSELMIDFLKEDEYVMRLTLTDCHILKWKSRG